MRSFRFSLMAIASLGTLLEAGEVPAIERRAVDPHRVVRGMTVSCQTWGWEWGSDAMLETMDELAPLGVNWIAIHPYARVQSDGTVSWRDDYSAADWLSRPIAEAHRRGMKILIKPHLAYWGGGFSWAGDIRFDTPEKWRRFFATHRKWQVALARATREADGFCVGTELDGTVAHEREWRETIAAVREVVGARPVTYAANWDSYERVRFWDALDAITVHGYFPLSRDERAPGDDSLAAAAREWVGRLEAYGRKHGRQVVIGELGYDISLHAALRPWEPGSAGRAADAEAADRRAAGERLQARCLRASLEAIEGSDVIVGAFLWKWFPGGQKASRGENFLMSTPTIQRVIAGRWAARGSNPSSPPGQSP